jgi:hypothetical protein
VCAELPIASLIACLIALVAKPDSTDLAVSRFSQGWMPTLKYLKKGSFTSWLKIGFSFWFTRSTACTCMYRQSIREAQEHMWSYLIKCSSSHCNQHAHQPTHLICAIATCAGLHN